MPGGRGEHNACRRRTRIWCVRPESNQQRKRAKPGQRFSTAKRVIAGLPDARTAISVGSRRERPMGRLITPVGGGSPYTKARYSRPISRFLNFSTRRFCVSGFLATAKRPLVSLSNRCTIPARTHFNGGRVMIQQRRLQSPPHVSTPGMNNQTRRFIQHNYIRVFVNNVQSNIFGGTIARRLGQRRKIHHQFPPAACSVGAFLANRTVYEDSADGNRLLPLGTRKARV